ncbi:phage holin family protein [uncultured Phascolarctobacterium sp.]|uniref:phage holin family protein n=1 Tax=uncultured Phascolarctobacterium sp. TaxID=512296 RepID=UPI0027D93179|nr:phage holin family protein [uncultured Phascolarctobacterium sp.]
MIKDYLIIGIGVVGSFIVNAFGGWDESMTTLILFMSIDYITGMMVAGVFHASPKTTDGGIESKAGWQGLCRKCVTLLFVIIGHYLDVMLNVDYVRNAVIIGFITNELISITENAGLMGIPLPAQITKALEVLKNERGEKEDGKN